MQNEELDKPEPTIKTFKDDAAGLVEKYQKPLILGSIGLVVLMMFAINHGCDSKKQADVEQQKKFAKKYNQDPQPPPASSVNNLQQGIKHNTDAERAANQPQPISPGATPPLVDCQNQPIGLTNDHFQAWKLVCMNGNPSGPAGQTSGVYNNPTPYPGQVGTSGAASTSSAPPAETKKSLAQEAAEARKRRELAAFTAPPSDDESPSVQTTRSATEIATDSLDSKAGMPEVSKPVAVTTPVSTEKKTDEAPIKNRPTSCLGLCQGRIIQTLLVNTLNGDFTGPVIVQVSVPLVDFATNQIIIPSGSVAFGESHAVSAFRQSRLAITFSKIQLRDGRIIYLDNKEPGLSQEGEMGIRDKVNNHWLQTFGVATVIGAIGALAQSGNSYSGLGYDPGVSMRNGISQQMGSTADRVLEKFLNIPPSLKERHGLIIDLLVMGDIPGWSRRLEN